MKILFALGRLFDRDIDSAGASQDRAPPDPLDHPELKRLSLREIADLPLNRGRQEDCEVSPARAAPPARHVELSATPQSPIRALRLRSNRWPKSP
jgi:hypothetical protein